MRRECGVNAACHAFDKFGAKVTAHNSHNTSLLLFSHPPCPPRMCDENESLAYRKYVLQGRGTLGKQLAAADGLPPLAVPEMLAVTKPTEAHRKAYLAEAERQMRNELGGKNFAFIAAGQVGTCLDIIDKTIFNGFLKRHIPYTATINRKGTTTKVGHCSAKYTTRKGIVKDAEIAFNAPLLFSQVPVVDGEIQVRECNGIMCRDRVAILANVLMHEVVHLIIQHFAKSQRKGGGRKWASHGTIFMAIVKNLFGHTKAMCVLITSVSAHSITKKTARVGQRVLVALRDHPPFCGTIQTLNPKRARIRLADEIVVHGERYKPGAIFRAHYELLQKIG